MLSGAPAVNFQFILMPHCRLQDQVIKDDTSGYCSSIQYFDLCTSWHLCKLQSVEKFCGVPWGHGYLSAQLMLLKAETAVCDICHLFCFVSVNIFHRHYPV